MDGVGEAKHMSGLAWWTIAGIALIGWGPGFMLQEGRKRPAGLYEDEENVLDGDSDTASVSTLVPDERVGSVLGK